MQPDSGNPGYLWDMRNAAREALAFIDGLTFDELEKDLRSRRALERTLEIIGEAARQVSSSFRAAHPEIPWQGIIGQRNILAHQYADVHLDRIWRVATNRLEELVTMLDQLLPDTTTRP